MNFEELEYLMRKHNVVIRTVPEKVSSVYEVGNKSKFPCGKIQYVEQYKRDMWVVERKPEGAGKFVLTFSKGLNSSVNFSNGIFFDNFEEIVKYLRKIN